MREKPDLETCTEGYARRFAGPVGRWFLEVQTRAALEMLADMPGAKVLDVGGGHGQLARPLADHGFRLTVLGSGLACAGPITDLLATGDCEFSISDLQRLPYPQAAFDVVISFRTIAHVRSWRTLLAELARVARTAIMLDFPTTRGFNALSPQLFGMKKRIEGNTRPYSLIPEPDLIAAAADFGFQQAGRYPQFMLPMAAHRGLGRKSISSAVEAVLRRSGLTARLGSPVITKFKRGGS